MGGKGSGPYSNVGRLTGRTQTEECCALDIRRYNREGLLAKGTTFIPTWKTSNGETSSVGVRVCENNTIQLTYDVSQKGETKTVSLSIQLERTQTNRGDGTRVWIRCPDCNRRCAILYLRGIHFKCRICHDLTYRSVQNRGNEAYEALAKANRILRKLKERRQCGIDIMSYTPRKPVRMHWTTFRKLKAEYEESQLSYIQEMCGILGSLKIL